MKGWKKLSLRQKELCFFLLLVFFGGIKQFLVYNLPIMAVDVYKRQVRLTARTKGFRRSASSFCTSCGTRFPFPWYFMEEAEAGTRTWRDVPKKESIS